MIQYDFAAPFDIDLLPGLELGNVLRDRRARSLRAFAGPEAHRKRDGRRDSTGHADRRRGAKQEPALAHVHVAFVTHLPILRLAFAYAFACMALARPFT